MERQSIDLDLISTSLRHLSFLEEVNNCPELKDSNVILNAVRRYETVWLPLAASVDKPELLYPPLDVQWIWHCHMLSPQHYAKDCKKIVGKVVDHTFLGRKAQKEGRKSLEKKWKEFNPNEMLDICSDECDYVQDSTYDLFEAAMRQHVFFYQVSLPHYKDKKFLKSAIKRYENFLHLKYLHPKEFLVPCYDMDLIWHTHQLHPKQYAIDTERIVGKLLPHDDSVNDRSVGSKLNNSHSTTKELWRKVFSEEHGNSGSMFRGLPPGLYVLDKSTKVKKHTIQGMPFEYQELNADSLSEDWGPIYFDADQINASKYGCIAAAHRVLGQDGTESFTLKILHSIPMSMSAALVYSNGELVCMGRLIGNEQLPRKDQVNKKEVATLRLEKGQRALLITDGKGDWGILHGEWRNAKKGLQGRQGHRGERGKPGHMKLKAYNLRNNTKSTTVVNKNLITVGNMSIDLQNASVNGKKETEEVNVCVAACIGLLHVLCRPHPMQKKKSFEEIHKEGKKYNITPGRRGDVLVESLYKTGCPKLYEIAGVHYDTPCNSYLMCHATDSGCAGCVGVGPVGCGACGGCGGCATAAIAEGEAGLCSACAGCGGCGA